MSILYWLLILVFGGIDDCMTKKLAIFTAVREWSSAFGLIATA
jgi:hypothetical protein